MSRARIIVTGLIAQYPLGGVAWDYLQYPLGLARMGHDVFYFEDTGLWPYNPQEGGVSAGCDFNVAYLRDLMERFGLADRWAYRFPWQDQWFGLADRDRAEVIASADLLINVSGSLADPAQYRTIPRLAYIDSDPVFTQLKLARGQDDFRSLLHKHDVHFTFGETLPATIPSGGFRWIATRQPIVLNEWRQEEARPRTFTTIMNWTSYKPIEFEGRTYGQKDVEFRKFMDLPASVTPAILEVALAEGKTRRSPRSLLQHKGWHVVNPDVVCPDVDSYRQYVQTSAAEFSVAKNGYVAGNSGWFSCRSACYLASGKPVVVQDTGFSAVIPTGAGVVAFQTPEQATEGIARVCADYGHHSTAAGRIAREFFDSHSILTALVEKALGQPRAIAISD